MLLKTRKGKCERDCDCKMKKCFFYANINPYDKSNGITKKVLDEVDAFKALGYEVYYTCYLEKSIAVMDAQSDEIVKMYRYFPAMRRITRRYSLMWAARKYVSKSQTFDLVYARYHFFDFTCLRMLKTFRRKAKKIIMEMHSYPCLTPKEHIVYYLDRLYANRCVKNIDLFASMSSDELPFYKPQVKITNTVNRDSVTIRKPEKRGDAVKMLAVSYERLGHGFDRVIRGLRNYYDKGGKRKFQVLFVGKYKDSTKQLVRDLRLENYCEFLPPAQGDLLDDYYNQSDLAIGHLANHRVGSFSGSSIKVQEYLAKGIPFVYAWNEMTVPEDFPYALKFELNDEPLDFNLIEQFINSLPEPEIVAYEMRKHFETFAGWDNQLKKVLEML